MSDDLFKGYGIEIELATPDKFNVVEETLSRIGFASRTNKTLYQSCHIFHKRGRYAIMHFKEMFAFDGRNTEISAEDVARRVRITELLEEWGLIKIIVPIAKDVERASLNKIKIVPFKEKNDWTFVKKYSIGK